MTAMIHHAVCERSRAYASLRLDGELAELEQMMLEAHLAGCVACRESARELAAITAAVRATPLETFDRLSTPRLRRAGARPFRHVAAVAATVLVAVGAGGILRQAEAPVAEQRAVEPTSSWPVPRRYLSYAELTAEQQRLVLLRPRGGSPAQFRF